MIVPCLALATLAAAEVASPSSLRLSAFLNLASIVLLILSFRRSYLVVSVLLSLCVGGYAVVRRFRPAPSAAASGGSGGHRMGGFDDFACTSISNFFSSLGRVVLRLLPSSLAALYHIFATWILPFCILYETVDARSDTEYFGQEIGHLAPATFYIVGLVVLPLLVLPKGYETASTTHQLYESIFNVGFSAIYFTIFRIAHHLRGQDPPRMSAPNWDHEFLGAIFCGSGLVGIFLALSNIRSHIHIVFPTGFVAYQMISHSNAHHMDMSAEDSWKLAWMKLHYIHGLLFGIGALCRLLDRVPESIFFFFLGAFAFVTSAQWIVQSLHNSVNYEDDPESQAAGRYPTDHVVPLLVFTVGTALYALFLGAATRLRKFLDLDADVAGGMGSFEALPLNDQDRTCADDDDEEEKKADVQMV